MRLKALDIANRSLNVIVRVIYATSEHNGLTNVTVNPTLASCVPLVNLAAV